MSTTLSEAQIQWVEDVTGVKLGGPAGAGQPAAPKGDGAAAPAAGPAAAGPSAGPAAAAGLTDAQKKQFEDAMTQRQAAIKAIADQGGNTVPYDAETKALRGTFDHVGKMPNQADRDHEFAGLMANVQASTTDAGRVRTAAVEDIGKAVQDMIDGAREMIMNFPRDFEDKGKYEQRLKDLDADVAKEKKLTDRRARAELLKQINVAAESLFDGATAEQKKLADNSHDPAMKAKMEAEVQAVYQKALKDRYGIEVQKPPGFKDTNLEKIYKMFDKVPEADAVQNKMKKLIYQWPDPSAPNSAGAAYWPGQGNIEFDNPMDASFDTSMEYTNPKTKQKEKPNWFNISTLHELGHSVDDRFGLMKANGAKPHGGGWQTHNVDEVADKMIAHFLKVAEITALGVTQQRLHALTVSALRGTVAQPPDINADAWNKLSGFVNTCAGRESSKKPWEHPLDIGGRSYHMAYSAAEGGEQWVSFAMASLAGFMSKYQWRAPAEWFAETYAFTWLKSVEAPGWVDSALAAYMYGGKVAAGAPQANKH